jgi:hypothetical protein
MLISVIRDMLKTARVEAEKREATDRRDAKTGPIPSRPAAAGVARHHVAKCQLTQDGLTREFETSVDLEDVERNGVAYSRLVRRAFVGRAGWMERLATLLNIASVCRESGVRQDELAALRMARRMSGGMELVEQRIAECVTQESVETAHEGGLRVVSYSSDPQAFEAIVGSAAIGNNFHHPGAQLHGLTGVNGQLLFPPERSADNVSFAVCDGKQRLAIVPCVIQHDDVISWVAIHVPAGGVPIHIHFDQPIRHDRRVLEMILSHLDQTLRAYGARHFIIREPFQDSMLLYKVLGVESMFAAEMWTRPVVCLSDSDEKEIFARVRKSYKSHINWGHSSLVMEYLSGDQVSAAKVEEVRKLLDQCHEKLIQKYGDGLTKAMFMQPMVMCQMNKGEIAIARTKDGIVCGLTVVTDAGGISHYTLGGSIPQQNKNPGQFIVYDAMLRAKARGAQFFHVNREYAAPVSIDGLELKVQSEHETNLIFFKRGFGERLEAFSAYKVFPQRFSLLGR